MVSGTGGVGEINGQAVLDQVESGQVPASWQVLRARKSGAGVGVCCGVMGLLILALFGVALAVVAGFITLAGGVFSQPPNGAPQLPGASAFGALSTGVLVVAAVIGGLVAVAFLFLTVRSLRMLFLPAAQLPVLVLLPEGFVERAGVFRRQQIRAVEYAALAQPELVVRTSTSTTRTPIGGGQTMVRTSTSKPIYLRLHWRNGGVELWRISAQYGSPEAIAQSVIAAHARYAPGV
jgi:hypothetical protein